MKNNEIRVEKLEKVQAPCHGCCFAVGIGLVATVVALT